MEAVQLDLERGVVVGAAGADADEEERSHDGYDSDGIDAAAVKKEEDVGTDDEDGPYDYPPQPSSPSRLAAKKEEEDTDNEEELADINPSKTPPQRTPPPPRFIMGPPPSLLHLATRTVARHLEKYPPSVFGALSELHWEGVVTARAKLGAAGGGATGVLAGNASRGGGGEVDAGGRKRPRFALDGHADKKRLPPLSEKVLSAIEAHPNNVHLSHSPAADALLWKEIVDHKFTGMRRPTSLAVPCDVLKDRLREWGASLVELVAPPMRQEEYLASEANCQQKGTDAPVDLFGELAAAAYHRHLDVQSNARTNRLRYIVQRLRTSPVDVALLADTHIGKSARRAIKSMKKLKKQHDKATPWDRRTEREREGALRGYPWFWKPVRWDHGDPRRKAEEIQETPLGMLQRILHDWKAMAAAEDGAETSADPPSTKEPLLVDGQPAIIATCGKDPNLSAAQHRIDMRLLHAAPEWRSLHASLRTREERTRKAHGDKVRSIRENVERGRPRVGKVVLKRAVGRVRGGDGDGGKNGPSRIKQPCGSKMGADSSQSARGPVGVQDQAHRRMGRREAILNKSRGHRALKTQHSQGSAASAGSKGKVSQLRQEARVAASFGKSSFAAPAAKLGFGASVARAGGGGGGGGGVKRPRPGAPVHVQLRGGKSMTLPSATTTGLGGRSGKAAGVFSSLQRKKAAKGRKLAKGGGTGNGKDGRKR